MVLCALALTAPLAAQECTAGRVLAGDLGIERLRCTGPSASCAINVRLAGDERPRHVFAVEPVIERLASDVAGLRTGDTLVAIDSVLITTAAGGARLARLHAGRPVRLLVRREGALVEILATPRRGCGIGSLRVTR